MSSTFTRSCRPAWLVTLALSGSCAIIGGNNYSVGFSGIDFSAYTVGDTVRFGAYELYQTMSDNREVTSSESPELFTWTTSAPDQAEVSEPGVFVMKAIGNATIGVRTSHAKYEIPITVIPIGAKVKLAPRDTIVTVGGKFAMRLIILDAQGTPLPFTRRASEVYFVLSGNGDVPPAFDPILTQELNTYSFTAKRAGAVGMVARFSVYKRPELRDSTSVTAR